MTDNFTAIGSTHFDCQDYSVSGDDFVIVADGCSSAPDSDWGSRLLGNTIRLWLMENPITNLTIDAFRHLPEMCEKFKINPFGLCSTFIAAQKISDKVVIAMAGDGSYVVKKKDGSVLKTTIEFETNAPYYAFYMLDDQYKERYLEQHEGKVRIDNGVPMEEQTCPIEDFMKIRFYEFTDFEYVAIFTDGIKSFSQVQKTATSITNKSIDHNEMMDRFLDIHNFNGKFLQRKCLFDFRLFKKKEISNSDDFSVGIIT